MSDEENEVVRLADEIYEALRTINHVTQDSRYLPAPVVYKVIGNLKHVGHMLPQALQQLSAGLGRSLDDYEVYEDDGGDPVNSIATASDHLTRAGHLAAELGMELEKAQSAIARQGHNKKRA